MCECVRTRAWSKVNYLLVYLIRVASAGGSVSRPPPPEDHPWTTVTISTDVFEEVSDGHSVEASGVGSIFVLEAELFTFYPVKSKGEKCCNDKKPNFVLQ
ncbi:hypothetical protein J6590_068398 [Homalodisca vitripennis]|nr:hypothetical protein J6590_068398 [Homalodisca vitripennis]